MAQSFSHAYGTAEDSLHAGAAMSPALHRATCYASESAEQIRALGAAEAFGDFYPRLGHQNGRRFEAAVARLEGTEGAVAFASGMAATHGAILGLCKTGDRVLVAEQVYGGTNALANIDLPRLGIEVERFDALSLDSLEEKLVRPARLVVVETPINPTLRLVDLQRTVTLCRGAGAVSLCDATFAPPPIQFVAQCGVDLVMHSATKFLGGHSDVLAGVIAGPHRLLGEIEEFRRRTGGILAPDPAWLLCRSMLTHEVRLQAQMEAAAQIATQLAAQIGDPRLGVLAVAWPGAQDHPDRQVVARQMPGGAGCLVTLTVQGGLPQARRVFDALRLIGKAPSLGGVESLASIPCYTTHASLTDQERLQAGIDAGMVRISVGLEGSERLLADLRQALTSAVQAASAS